MKNTTKITASIALLLCIAMTTPTFAQSTTATPSSHVVYVDNQPVGLQAFLIGGNNFFMLRDVAYTLNGTGSQFEVGWNGALAAINLITGQEYTPVGGEMSSAQAGSAIATSSTATILVNGQPENLRAYTINANNFFMLRDLGDVLGFDVDWDGAVVISTAPLDVVNYTVDNSENFERAVFDLVNIEREAYGLPALVWHDGLALAARAHSQDMASNNFMSHTGSNGSTFISRLQGAGISMWGAAENVASGQRTPDAVMRAWMGSPGHRGNILSLEHTHLGVGFDNNRWTQKFALDPSGS